MEDEPKCWASEEALLSQEDNGEEREDAEGERADDGDVWVKPTFSLKSLINVTHFIVSPLDP